MEQIKHEPSSDHPEWNESYYFIFENKEHNIKGMSRLGIKPNKNEAMTFLFLFLPDGTAAGYYRDETIEQPSLKVGNMQHEAFENSWKYQFNGKMIQVRNSEDMPRAMQDPRKAEKILDVRLDLAFQPINEVYEYSEHMTAESLELGKKAGDLHWEQIGLSNGTIVIDEVEYQIQNTISQRDHTHGIRDWTAIGDWLYYVIWFSENLAVNPAAIIGTDGQLSTGGFVFRDGKNIPLRSIKVLDQQFRPGGIYPVSSKLELTDVDGNFYTLTGSVEQIIPLPFTDLESGEMSILIQAFGSFEMDGKKGFGSFETLRKVPS